MAEDNVNVCKNPPCGCAVTDEKYCSAACEGAGDSVQIDCDCGHETCGGDF